MRAQRPYLCLRHSDGRLLPLDLARWRGPADAADEEVVDRCQGPALDVGCGAGRLVLALHRRGITALGLDTTPAAVAMATSAGANVLHRSVFAPVPGEGQWATVILADGSIGIGGDPPALLRRTRALLARHGSLLLEVEDEDIYEHRAYVRLEDGRGRRSRPFLWARVGRAAAHRLAPDAGFRVQEAWIASGRRFLTLEPA
ncbi:methyltransferase domain-containing protein [Streptomyces sp. NPDC051286]|uniref:methyltransferase domain-containing protein n=1 Tax=Streptomyces sp. NPDC051286 TaxID=3365647 RepID=UPI0037AEA502